MANLSLIPIMTSNTAPSGVASGSTKYATVDYYFAFKPNLNGWLTAAANTGYLQYQFPASNLVRSYSIIPWSVDNFPGRSPKTWTFQGSNDGAAWTTLDTQTNYVGWVFNMPSYFIFNNNLRFLYYKLAITLNGGNAYLGIQHLAIYPYLGANYLHARRDRMNMRGVSTQNSLA